MRERRVLLSQAAVRAISSYKEFAKGALHATDEDADEASRALQVTVQQTFHDLKMKYLPRNWLEIIAVKAVASVRDRDPSDLHEARLEAAESRSRAHALRVYDLDAVDDVRRS